MLPSVIADADAMAVVLMLGRAALFPRGALQMIFPSRRSNAITTNDGEPAG